MTKRRYRIPKNIEKYKELVVPREESKEIIAEYMEKIILREIKRYKKDKERKEKIN